MGLHQRSSLGLFAMLMHSSLWTIMFSGAGGSGEKRKNTCVNRRGRCYGDAAGNRSREDG